MMPSEIHPAGHTMRAPAPAFSIRYPEETLAFVLVFVVIFSSLKLTGIPTTGSVEQWLNLTQQMFYGQQDFLFSYGPLCWLEGRMAVPFNTYTHWASLLYLSLVGAGFWAVLFTVCYRARAWVFFAIAYFLFFPTLHLSAAQFLWPFAIIVYLQCARERPLNLSLHWILLLGLLVGLSFYVRFFYGLSGLATLGSYLFVRGVIERKSTRVVLFSVAVVVSFLLSGWLIFHDVASIWRYIAINKELSFGNSIDMTYDVVNYRWVFMDVALIAVAFNVYLLVYARSLWLPVNILLLLLFKLGFSRTDHYYNYFVVPVAVLALVMLSGRNLLARGLFLLVMGGLYYLSSMPIYPGALVRDALANSPSPADPFEKRMQTLYAPFKLDDQLLGKIGNATIDVYPYNNEYLYANGLNYRHRPLFQNYMTLTPKLDAMNQAFFESAERPEYVLWTGGMNCHAADCNIYEGFDQKYTLNEDPLTSSAILMNYHVVGSGHGRQGAPVVLLQQNNERVRYSSTPLSAQAMTFDQWYDVPEARKNAVIKLAPRFKFTLYGQLQNLLFRGSVLKMKYRMTSGEVREYRLNVLNAQSGVWISPLLDGSDFSGETVQAVMFSSASSNYFQPDFTAAWIDAPIPGLANRPVAFDPALTLTLDAVQEAGLDCKGFIDNVNGLNPVPATVTATSVLSVRGWLAFSTDDGTLFEQTFVTLTDDQGTRQFFPVKVEERGDVATVFKHPTLARTGFSSLIDVSAFKGRATLGLAGMHDGHLYRCNQFTIAVMKP